MARRGLLVAAAAAALLGAAAWLTTPPVLVNAAAWPNLPDDIEAWLAETENQVAGQYALVPGTEKRVTWHGDAGARTPYAVVSLHGFSATRQETAPLAEHVATALDANLFETRLTGHGHTDQPMHGAHAEDWLADAAEALAIGARLGDRIVVIGTSTGGTLALAMSDHPAADAVTDIVLMSPNVQPSDANAAWLTRPAGPLIARMVAGDTRSWKAHNEQQARYWTTSYPIEAAIEMMRLVDLVNTRLPMRLRQNLLVLLSPRDTVVSPAATKQAYERIDAPRKALVEIEDAGDPSSHVLAGDILSPDSTGEVAATIVDFVLGR